MKIAVTGGAGFIGSNIVDEFIRLGHNVVVIDDLSTGRKDFINKKAKFYQVDITNKERIKKIFAEEKPDILNHHAAQISVRISVKNPLLDANINIIGLLNLLEACKLNGTKKVIFASSGGAIYGDAQKIPTPEDYEPKKPLSAYGVSKYSSEIYLQYYYLTFGIAFIALRYSNVFGPRQNPHGEAGVVAIFAKKLLNGEKPLINGDGKQTRDYIYVGDIVLSNVKALSSDFIGAVNVATSKETNVIDLLAMLKKITQKKIKEQFGPAKKGEQIRSCLDIKKAEKTLKFTPQVSLMEGLQKTVDYFQERRT